MNPEADFVLYNGKVVTLDDNSRTTEALAVRAGRITATGDARSILQAHGGPDTSRIDLGGRTVVPGFVDTHPHMDREGLKRTGGISIAGLTRVADILQVVRQAAATHPPGEWIVLTPMGTPPMRYVNQPEQLEEGRFPDRHDLDSAAPEHPVYIRSPWCWWTRTPLPCIANSKALELARIDRDTEAPYNTEIVRDDKGEPTGVFLDWNFQFPVLDYTLFTVIPDLDHEQRVEGIRFGSFAYNAAGTTTAYEGHGLTPAFLRAYREIHERGDLTVQMRTPVSIPTANFDDDEIAELLYHYGGLVGGNGVGDERLRIEGITLDTAFPHIADVISKRYPYEQWAGHFYQALDRERLVRIGMEAARQGIRVNCLVCYDLEMVLSAFEEIDAQIPIRDKRWVGIHAISATPEQMRRIRDLGLVLTVVPNFMYQFPERFKLDELGDRALPLREFLDAGIPVALSTDNVPYSMIWTMWETLARWDDIAGTRHGEADLTREEVLRMAVQTGHLLSWSEDRGGSIEPGKKADLAVLNGDPLTCPLDTLRDISVELTMVDGTIVYDRSMHKDSAPPTV